MKNFCTYFDRAYLCQALSLYASLERHETTPFVLWMLCLDKYSISILRKMNLPHARLISVNELLSTDPNLTEARDNRSRIEFYYVCTPALVNYIFSSDESIDLVTYVDADMFFFSSPEEVFAEEPDAQINIVEHRRASNLAGISNEHGRFNVCLLTFRRSKEAMECVNWWAGATFRSTRFGDGVWGDQKYLDEFPERFRGVHIIKSDGVGLAPWNIGEHKIVRTDGHLDLENGRLIVYHFARFIMVSRRLFVPIRRIPINREHLTKVYIPYMQQMRSSFDDIRKVDHKYRLSYSRHNLRGLLLGIILGRAFFQYRNRLVRIGFRIPIGDE